MNYNKLKEFGKSFVWLLGAMILFAQVYRIIAFYLFHVDFEVQIGRDGAFAFFGFVMMFIQSGLKTAVTKVLKRKSESL